MTLPRIATLPLDATAAQQGDARGAYGYGRPAHGSDPQATYRFEPPANVTAPSIQMEHLEDIAAAFTREATSD